jgi:hypothetical protein
MQDPTENNTPPPPTSGGVCTVCQCEVMANEPVTVCPECQTTYHTECWQYNGGCGVYGCDQAPATEGLTSLEIPAAHWGREDKPCPNCGTNILAAAKRCKHCGATFSAATPQGEHAYREERRIKSSLGQVKTVAICVLVFGVIPCTAPLAAIIGGIWLISQRKAIRKLPAVVGALAKIGVGVAVFQTLVIIGVVVLKSMSGI